MISNKDLETMIKIENLVGTRSKDLFGADNDKKVVVKWYDKSETVITIDDFIDYMNIIEKIIKEKKVRADKQNKRNKENKEYHKIVNNIYNAKKNNDKEKLIFWRGKLEEYKKNK